ncbi:MAG: hypothetical protein Q8L64_03855 [bacterium]|nr:hypothetical protein [bacterium]
MFNKRTILITLAPLLLLIIPLVGVFSSQEWQWGIEDFVLMGVILVGCGFAYAFISRYGNFTYRAAVGIAVVASFLIVWVNMAVGIIGSEDNAANLMYFAVPFIGLIGAGISRFEPRGMSWSAFAAAIAVILIPVIAAFGIGVTFERDLVQIVGLSSFFALLYAVSAYLFRMKLG